MRAVPSLYMWMLVEAPLVCDADRRGSTARRTHEEEKVEPVRSTTSSTSTRATSREFLRLLSIFFRYAARRVVTIYDLILAWFLVYMIENFDLCYRSLRISQQSRLPPYWRRGTHHAGARKNLKNHERAPYLARQMSENELLHRGTVRPPFVSSAGGSG